MSKKGPSSSSSSTRQVDSRRADGQPPTHFEVIGVGSGGFQPARAEILGDSIKLTSDAVETPLAFRFAWHKLAEPNLVGGTGLPVGAFRGGKVPDFADSVPDADEYQLVYDIDLSKLDGNVQYAIDNSQSVGKFNRVAYLLELSSKDFGEQAVFVSANAFTKRRPATWDPDRSIRRHVSAVPERDACVFPRSSD